MQLVRAIPLVLALSLPASIPLTASDTPPASPTPQPMATLLVLDRIPARLVALNGLDGSEMASVPLRDEPESMMLASPSRLVILNHAVKKAVVTIVDLPALKVLARLDLGWGIPGEKMADWGHWSAAGIQLSQDGKVLAVLCPGVPPANGAELVVVDVEKAEVVGRMPASVQLVRMFRVSDVRTTLASPDGKTALLYSPQRKEKGNAVTPASLGFVDLTIPRALGTLTLDQADPSIVFAADGASAVLWDASDRAKDPRSFQIISMSERSIAGSFSTAGRIRAIVPDEVHGRIIVLSDGIGSPPVPDAQGRPQAVVAAAYGELRVIHGAIHGAIDGSEVSEPHRVVAKPTLARLSPDGALLIVGGEEGLSLLDSASLTTIGDVALAGSPVDIELTRDRKRLLATIISPGDRLSSLAVIDLDPPKVVAVVKTGSESSLQLAETATAASMWSLQLLNPVLYQAQVSSMSEAKNRSRLFLDATEKRAYVRNSLTGELSVVDLAGQSVLKRIRSGHSLLRISDTEILSVEANFIAVIDLQTNERRKPLLSTTKGPGLGLGVFQEAVPIPGGPRIFVRGTRGVYFVDLATSEAKRCGPFKSPIQVLLLP